VEEDIGERNNIMARLARAVGGDAKLEDLISN